MSAFILFVYPTECAFTVNILIIVFVLLQSNKGLIVTIRHYLNGCCQLIVKLVNYNN